jgi:glycosyltransferase involved in cell wall biosynthesis
VRILYFSRDYTPHDYRFLHSLDQSGNEVVYLRLQRGAYHRERRPIPSGVRVVSCCGGRADFHWVQIPAALRAISGIIREAQPDLVHAGPVQSCAFLAALIGFQPLVTMSWGFDLFRNARAGFGRWVAQFTLRRTRVLLCDCETIAAIGRNLGMPADRIVIFPWGVDLDLFSPGDNQELRSELGWESAFVVLSSRSWERIYGVDLVVEGFVQAVKQEPKVRLLMLGDGSLGPKIRQMVSRAGLEDRVHFAGQVGYDDLPGYYRAADMYVSASHADGSSISLLEAMACGLPAAVSDIPGNREWVQHGVTGWWFGDEAAGELTEVILQAARDPLACKDYGEEGRQIAKNRADWKMNFQKLLQAYQLAQTGG